MTARSRDRGNGPPFSGVGHCAYYKDRLLIDSRDTSGNRYGGTVDYSTGHVKWGETSYVGGWAGAGTNGGINFGLLSNSCGVRWPYVLQQLGPIFAGMDVLGIVMPNSYGSDDVDAPVRGTALADAFVLGTQSSVGHAWADSIAGVPYNDGNPCPTGWQNYDYGGGHGMDGCGAQLTVTMDSSANNAFWDRDYQTWSGITIPSSGSQGNAYWAYLYECNYDCNTYPITLP